MNIEKYKNDGWGISRLGFTKINEIIDNNFKETYKIVEFGSGNSTRYLIDKSIEKDEKIVVDSFDNDLNFAFKDNKKYTFLNFMMRDLVECNDINYNVQFNNKRYDPFLMKNKESELSTRQRNNFYNIKSNDLNNIYDLIILDGPNGNGRTFAYLHLMEHVNENTYIYIDDFLDHDIHEKFKLIFPNAKEYYKHISQTGKSNQWINGGDFIIYKLT